MQTKTRIKCCQTLRDELDCSLFKVLGDPSRLAIFCRVIEIGEPASVNTVAACCPKDVSVVSRHLAALRDAGVVCTERRGKEVLYSPCCDELAMRFRHLAARLERCS